MRAGLDGLSSTRVVLPEGVRPASVLFEAGRIVAIERRPLPEVEDVGDLVISPGLVDCHVHINEPGRAAWEGFETATKAAAAGGVTTLIDMPLNSLPVTTNAAALAHKLSASQGKRFVDVGFWGGVVPDNVRELEGLAQGGVLGCKAFLVHSGIDEFPNSDEADLRRALPVLRDLGLPLLAHAELDLGAPAPHPDVLLARASPDVLLARAGPDVSLARASARFDDPRAYSSYLASRPNAWEDEAIKLLVRLCRETRCPVHIVHLSSASSIETLRRAKDEGLPISAETCPHYLCFAAEAIPDGATQFKCAPPIREDDNRERLWQALFEGVIDFVITDHSPCAPALKLPERGDFMAAWGGIASLQLGLSAIWSEARRRGGTLAQLAQWMSAAPARFAGLHARKGRIAVGCDADLLVWDPEQSFEVVPERLFFRHKVSPYLGTRLSGVPAKTLLRGQLIYDGIGHPAGAVGTTLLHRSGHT
jgi:allantoinase